MQAEGEETTIMIAIRKGVHTINPARVKPVPLKKHRAQRYDDDGRPILQLEHRKPFAWMQKTNIHPRTAGDEAEPIRNMAFKGGGVEGFETSGCHPCGHVTVTCGSTPYTLNPAP